MDGEFVDQLHTWKVWKVFVIQASVVTVFTFIVFFVFAAIFGPSSDRKKAEESRKIVREELQALKIQEGLERAATERKQIEAKVLDLSVKAENSMKDRDRIKAKLDKVAEEVK